MGEVLLLPSWTAVSQVRKKNILIFKTYEPGETFCLPSRGINTAQFAAVRMVTSGMLQLVLTASLLS